MERLKGKTILIGKEPGQGRLAILVAGKVALLGTPGSVPGCVSRLKDGTAHCKIMVAQDGSMTITNLKDANVTYVNGAEVMSKRIDQNSRVQLGKDRYDIDVKTVLQAAIKLLPPKVTLPPPPPPVKEYSIRHLERVWNNYTEIVKKLRTRQKNINLLSSIPMAFSMFGGLIAGIAPDEIRMYAYAFTGVALVILVYGLYKRFTDNTQDEAEELKKKLQRDYVCPNCGHYLEGREYPLLLQDGKCRYCGAKFKV